LKLENFSVIMIRTTGILSLLAAVILVGGCRRAAQERKYDVVTGVASEIDLETGNVSMDWRNEETGDVRRLTGLVTQETEIFINGIGAELADARIGDEVTVVVYHYDDEPTRWIVTRVQIERQERFVREHPRETSLPAGEESDSDG
jgi:hypothetical protein